MTGYFILGAAILALLVFDLFSHRKGEEISLRSASLWSAFYVMCALGFGAYIYFAYSPEWAQLYLTGYALEKVLAVDNLFAFMIIFSYFKVPSAYQHRILYWGILGAIVFRGIFVYLGTAFAAIFGPWASLIFAAIIGWTAYKMLTADDADDDGAGDVDYANAWYVKGLKKIIPVTDKVEGSRFFLKAPNAAGKMVWAATPIFICLVAIEISDIIFAFDSVPAIIAVTQEPYLVFAAMMFAILGLRSLYFVLEAMRRMLSKLETMVIVILMFIAGKLGVAALSDLTIRFGLVDLKEPLHLDPSISLAIVLTLLVSGIVWSIVDARSNNKAASA